MARSARVLAMANQKGGVAKTTSSLNVAVALREKGMRVLVVDLDPQSNLSMSQGIDVEALDVGMFDVLVRSMPISDIVHVRSPQAERLRDLVAGPTVQAALVGANRLEVIGMSSDDIGNLAAANAIALHELTPQQASLEEAFMTLTRDSVEYHTSETATR